MGKLIHKEKIILSEMKVLKNVFQISKGLMFAGKKKIEKGACLILPNEVKFGASVTMFFCFYPLEILFINNNHEVVDKKILKPWHPNYTPKKPSRFVIESKPGKFKNINIGDKVKICF